MFDTIPKSLYPPVPNLAGVPAVLRSAANIVDTATFGKLGAGEIVNKFLGGDKNKWGIYYKDGTPIAKYDALASIAFTQTYDTATHPVEGGKFESYNKVAAPYSIIISMSRGGTLDDRIEFEADVKNAVASLEQMTIITDSSIFTAANVKSISSERTSRNGVTLLTYKLEFTQIRDAASVRENKPKNAEDQAESSTGAVQPVIIDAVIAPGDFA